MSLKIHVAYTAYGPQRHHWSRANGEILDTYTLVAAQGKSLAPSYNGNSENMMLALFAYPKGELTDEDLKCTEAFADGAVTAAPKDALLQPFCDDNVKFKEVCADNNDGSKLKNPVLTGLSGNLGKYVTRGTKAISHIIKEQIKSKK